MSDKLSAYELSRFFFDWSFENPEKIKPEHSAIYFFAIEHCNRLGWKDKFGLPSQMVMEALGIKRHQSYIKYFNDLVEWGFIILVQKSTNQYSSNIVALPFAMPKSDKALDKALIKHTSKQAKSNAHIDKQYNNITKNKEQELTLPFSSESFILKFELLKTQPHWKNKTNSALQESLNKLSKYSESEAIEMMSNAIIGNWRGLFEIDKKPQQKTGKLPFDPPPNDPSYDKRKAWPSVIWPEDIIK
ncbi:hypothetical protein UFOVP1483_10 [uncultured Caudovirales phage]|uniref:Uncharacterized protein n=1 Tax=uncultured Caudovirales phage TaxID=2100421 RepID=A0A6J5SKY4_9CAUD|nr:hypothetical protein UFOVP1483_10 [uncultured Caudovirales phage]